MTVAGKKAAGEEEESKMELSLIKQDKAKMNASFILKNASPIMANMLRRIIIEEVPTMAIEDVEISKNNSIMYDEIIAHRLGLVPLNTDLKSYTLKEECKCEGKGCARCTIQMKIKKKDGIVYASDIKSKDPKIVPVYPKTPIINLLKGQDFEAVMTAELGKGKEHIKWVPGVVWYKYKPVIEIIQSKIKNPEDIIRVCPKGILQMKGSKLEVDNKKLLDCDLCAACADAAPDGIKLNEKDDEFVFYIESFGQLKVKEILMTAMDMLKINIAEFEDAIGKMK